jgi:PrcB C-terminal
VTEPAPHPLAWRDLTGALGPVQLTRPAGATFVNADDLSAYLRAAMPGRVPHVPPVDFERAEVVLIASGTRSSTGYALHVLSVTERSDRVIVAVREETPTPSDPVRAELTYPHRLIELRRPGKPVSVHWQGRP